ncbi:MAG: S8 family serine peptidase [Gammaproteobacteria bacterium]|nr:S8 family serine peptidase [Gammaproteobacteria bacterium]
MKVSRSNVALTLLLVGLTTFALTGLLGSWKQSAVQEISVLSPINEVNQAVIDQIRQYGRYGSKEAAIVGAPKTQVEHAARSALNIPTTPISANDDYSTVSVDEEMQKGSLDRRESHSSPSAPNNGGRAWLDSSSGINSLIAQAEEAGRDWTFGWIQINRPLQSDAIEKKLRQFGSSVLGSTGDLVRAKLKKSRKSLESIDSLSWVSGLAALPPRLKLQGNIKEIAYSANPSSLTPVFVTVVDSHMEEAFRNEFKRLGLIVGHFDPSIRVFPMAIRSDQVAQLARLDFVQSIEPIAVVEATHDTAVPALGVDALREVGATSGEFTGTYGVTTPIGVMDSGLNTNHVAISSLRKSICGANFISTEDHDLWIDEYGHGTHVAGTMAGNGFFQPRYAGMAPGIEHIRFAKVLNSFGTGNTFAVIQGMDFLAKSSACPEEGWSEDRIKPLIVNMSLSSRSLEFDGRSTGPRKLDAMVWTHQQLYVVSNANARIYGYSNYGSAKNSLAVGNVHDNGDTVASSSVGPTVDGRLLPSLVGTGSNVFSAEGNASYDGYLPASGTSMSSPSVAGVAALLMDASPEHREQPALVRARLMASAVKLDAWFESESVFPRNNTNGPGSMQAQYGMGMVSARTSIVNNDVSDGWLSSGATVTLEDGEYAYQDIVVPEGASRLDIAMTWDEPPADTITSSVLNNLDLWVDLHADCGSGSCGEYSSRSIIDNVEWVIITDPEPGTYRVKIAGVRIFTDPPRAAIAWTLIRGDSTPTLTIEVEQDAYTTEDGASHNHSVEVVVSTSEYVASGTELHLDCRTQDGEPCASFGYATDDDLTYRRKFRGLVQREDGIGTNSTNVDSLYLGEVAHGEEQRVLLQLASETSEPLNIYLTATSWNANGASTPVVFNGPESNAEPDNETNPPANDSYANPLLLGDPEGSIEIDTLLATSEPGEPIRSATLQRPTRSIWFRWIAESSGLTSFAVNPRGTLPNWYLGYSSDLNPSVDVFQVSETCCGIASSDLIGSSDWSVQFFAEEGKEYRIRIGSAHASIPLVLNWLIGERPPNDNFADAITITGSSGTVSGHNMGATIEPGEFYGTLSSTIWYRWTAPATGNWSFHIEDAQLVHILVFTGDAVDKLRLVSGISAPGDRVSVATVEDETYNVMVASPNARSGGWQFNDLSWNRHNDSRNSWNWFESGRQLSESETGTARYQHEQWMGVEPGEHESTGVQTGWLKWVAPSSGRYTWYWDQPSFHLAPFSGNAVDELSDIKHDAVASGTEFVFEAEEGEEYAISFGRTADSYQAYTYTSLVRSRNLWWGKTPENNTISGATVLSGMEGSIIGSNQFATTSSAIRRHLGYSSLWYTYEAEQTGWYRFWVENASSSSILSAFHPQEANFQPQFIAKSRPSSILEERIEVFVYVEEGASVLLRVGTARPHMDSEFELNWSNANPPNWLVYRGRIADNWRDDSGRVIALVEPSDMTFNSDGTLLFVATEAGISTFRRDTESGRLSLIQEISEPAAGSCLIWDPHRNRLYANKLDNWWIYDQVAGDATRLELDRVDYNVGLGTQITKRPGPPVLFLGNNGDYLYKSTDFIQAIYTFGSQGNLELVGSNTLRTDSVYPSADGNHWWKWNWHDEQLLVRELGTGFFRAVANSWENERAYDEIGAFSHDEQYFLSVSQFAWYQSNFEALSIDFSTGEISSTITAQFDDLLLTYCSAAIPRANSNTLDVLCSGGAYVVEYDFDLGNASLSDYVATIPFSRVVPDAYGRALPEYDLAESGPIEPSPDGKHIYAATLNQGILIFERLGNEIQDLTSTPTFRLPRLDLLRASKNQIQFASDTATDGCIAANEWVVDEVSYTVEDSKWQQRTVDSIWSDIEGTEKSGELCSYAPAESKEFRMVATFTVDGETIEFASNFFGEIEYVRLDSLTVSPGEIELAALTMTDCTAISNLGVNGVTYTVHESKWQVRDDSENDWSNIDSTRTTGDLCPYDPDDSREYRLVGRFTIDDDEGYYSSNVMQEGSDQT